MEAFSLLKYWRSSGASAAHATNANTTVTNVEPDDEGNADDGPFFDMEFEVNDSKGTRYVDNPSCFDVIDEEDSDGCDCEEDEELKFTLSSVSSGDSIDPNISLSPCDDLFFKGRLVPLTEPDSGIHNSNTDPKPVSKSTKLRVLMLKLKNSTKLNVSKTGENENDGDCVQEVKYKAEKEQIKQSARFFTVKFKVEEVPVLSMFTRDNSSKAAITKRTSGTTEKSVIEEEEKVFSKETVNKYLKKVKPLYVRVSKRYGEKLGFSGHLSLAGAITPKVKHLPGKLRVVGKQLGKSKSASSTVTAAAADSPPVVMVAKRRDDSLLQQQDGIQSAIMHCKMSFKTSRELEGKGKCEVGENVPGGDLSCLVDKAKGEMH